MANQVLKYIEKYDTIIIHRHNRPDMDAIGSQMGLFYLIKENYPNKQVHVVGDSNNFMYKAKMDEISDDKFKGALSIIIDVAVSNLISDNRYQLASDIVIIDHHKNATDLDNVSYFYHLSDYTSACEIVVSIAKELNLKISEDAATYLYGGMVTDTGRFQYIDNNNASRLFENAAYITKYKPNIQAMYNFLYTEELEKRVVKDKFRAFELTKNFVAYRKNTKEIINDSRLDVFSVSRGMVNLMAGINEVPIWVSFTEDEEKGVILTEIRSRDIIVVDIAKKYGGGGHNFACGASLKDFKEADLLLNDLNERAKENGY